MCLPESSSVTLMKEKLLKKDSERIEKPQVKYLESKKQPFRIKHLKDPSVYTLVYTSSSNTRFHFKTYVTHALLQRGKKIE